MRRLILAGLLVAAPYALRAGTCMEPVLFDRILRANVDADGFVDYDAIRINKGGDLYEYITLLEAADLSGCSEPERLAFWINAYNANMIRLVLARPQLKMVSDDFKLFGERFKVAKVNVTLNDIEHRVLRSSTKNGGPIPGVSVARFDPRIHFALVCGARDCPRLLNRAYQAKNLDETLQSNAMAFANNAKYIRIEDGTLAASSLLHWYADDFTSLGGAGTYVSGLIDPAKRPDAAELKAKISTDFPDKTRFRYDWTLNSIRNRPVLVAPTAPVK